MADNHDDLGFVPSQNEHEDLGFVPLSPSISPLESAIRGGAEGMTFGAAPAISGAIQAVPTALDVATGSGSIKDILDKYNAARQATLEANKQAQEANPKSYLAGQLAGGLPLAALTGGVSEEAAAAQGLSQLTGKLLAPKIAAAALTGAGYGAASGAGQALSEGQTTKQALGTIGGQAAGGAVLGGGLSGIGSGIDSLGSALGKTDLGSKLAGAYQMGTEGTNLLTKEGRQSAMNKVYDVANKYVGKEGLLGKLQSEKGKEIGDLVSLSGDQPSESLIADLNSKLEQLDVRDPRQASDKAEIQNILNNYAPKEGQQLTVEDLQSLKGALSNLTAYKNDSLKSQQGANIAALLTGEAGQSAEQQVPGLEQANDVYSALKSGLANLGTSPDKTNPESPVLKLGNLITGLDAENMSGNAKRFRFNSAIDKLSQVNPELASQLQDEAKSASKQFGIAQQAANTNFKSDSLASLAKSASTLSANALGQGVGKISNTLSAVSKTLTGADSASLAGYGQRLMSSDNDIAKRLGGLLVEASNRDAIGKNALIFALMQNPGYRELLKSYTPGAE